jgi:hypothetical protein
MKTRAIARINMIIIATEISGITGVGFDVGEAVGFGVDVGASVGLVLVVGEVPKLTETVWAL